MSNSTVQLEMKKFKIYKITTNLALLSQSKSEVHLATKIRLLIPKDAENKECSIEISVAFTDKKDDVIVTALACGSFDIPDSIDSQAEKQEILSNQGSRQVYAKLQEAIDKILEISNISFMSLPPFDEVVKK